MGGNETPWVKGVAATWVVVNTLVTVFLAGWLARDQGVTQWTIIWPVMGFQLLVLVGLRVRRATG